MSRHLHLATHLSVAALEQRSRAAHEPPERSWWQILWLLARGQTATAIADTTGYPRGWIGQIAKRDNDQGPDALVNRQHTTSWRGPAARPGPDEGGNGPGPAGAGPPRGQQRAGGSSA